MITPEDKDLLLMKLIELPQPIYIDREFLSAYGSASDMIISQFVKRGLVSVKQSFGFGERIINIEVDAHDHIQRGGFKFEEDIFTNSFTKLEMELAKLEGDIPDERFKNIMTLIGTACAAVSAYSGLN